MNLRYGRLKLILPLRLTLEEKIRNLLDQNSQILSSKNERIYQTRVRHGTCQTTETVGILP
jgi:hypothetical protein